ncbi:MAG: Jag N-terminal domain-containing protein [Lachnospiraceae bacterium]|nr:Jag N-terminal domain-containing protein [Lachnospiraceae bacterium]
MRSVEVTGKTKDEAITKAIIELGVPEEQVDIQVLSEGGKGLMGLFSKGYKILATIKDDAEPVIQKKEETEDKPSERLLAAIDKNEASHSIQVEGLTVTGEKVIINDTIEQRLRKAKANQNNEAGAGAEDRSEGKRREYRRNDRFERRSYRDEEAREEIKEQEPVVFEPKTYEIPADAEDVIARTCSFLKDLLANMGIDATVTGAFSEAGILEIDIAGEGMGLIIGKRGATLDSLQYLATLVINKDRKDHVRMKLDTEGYRSRRQETLEKLAINMAKKAKRTGHRVVLEPMNPYERRIIHATLQTESGVETHSDGEEPYRKVIISPKRRH